MYGPGDIYPRGAHERELCDKAASTDWIYLSTAGLATVGSVVINSETKYSSTWPVRFLGPASVGLSMGWLIGSLPLALPQCSETGMRFSGREGDTRKPGYLAISLALGSVALSSITMAVATGQQPQEWGNVERAGRVLTTSGFAIAGSLLPYLLPPKTWRAAEELRKLRFEASEERAFVTYSMTF